MSLILALPVPTTKLPLAAGNTLSLTLSTPALGGDGDSDGLVGRVVGGPGKRAIRGRVVGSGHGGAVRRGVSDRDHARAMWVIESA